MQKKLSLLVIMIAALFVAGAALAEAKTVFRYGSVQAADHVYNQGVKKLAELVAERTKGELEIQVFPDSRLGANPAMMDQVKNGLLTMGQFPAGTLGEYDNRMSIFDLYYLFKDFDHFKASIKGPIMQKMADMYLEKTGVRVLGYFGGLDRSTITAKKAINSIDDFKGLKMRAWEWKPSVEWWEMLGAIPAILPFKEVYNGMQTGVVDGAENDLSTFDQGKFAEVGKFIAMTSHTYTIRPVVINERKFQELSPEIKQAFLSSVPEALDYQIDLAEKSNVETVEILRTKYGCTITYPDKAPIIKISHELARKYAKQVGVEDVVEQFIAEFNK